MITMVRRRLLLRLVMLADLCVFIVSLLTALWASSFGSAAGRFAFSRVIHLQIEVLHFILLLVAMFVWHVSFNVHRMYQSRRLDKESQVIVDILKATTWGTTICICLAYIFSVKILTPVFILVFWLSGAALAFVYRYVLNEFLVWIRQSGKNLRYVVIVGTNRRAHKLAHMLEEKKSSGYRVLGYVDNTIHLEREGINLLGTLKDVPSIMKSHVIDEIIVTLTVKSHYEEIQRIVHLAEEQGIRTRFLADIFETKSSLFRDEEIESVTVMTALTGRQKEWYLIAKRMADIILAFLMLLLSSPVMLITALAIKVTSPGPIFFIQTRVGINKRRFRLYKFRTMVANAEKLQSDVEHLNEMDGPVFKISNDPRISGLGKWIRRTSIDELPQLFNVLKGDMSLVGPRPLPERDYHGFDKDWQRKRFSVLPGITCIWQVSGRNNVAFEEWMKMDVEYIENCSPLYDFKILLKTIPAVIRKRGAA